MKAVVYEKYGPPEVLKIKEVEQPVAGDCEVLVKVFAVAVTVGDVRLRKADPFLVRIINGLINPKKKILGMNFAGEIASKGKNVTQFREGDRVFGSTEFNLGAYAEYIVISEDKAVTTMPHNMSFEEAAVVPFGALTSLHFLRKGNIKEGQNILIYGASGSLGTAGVQIARYFNAKVTGVCSGSNSELVKSLGAEKVIDYTKEDIAGIKETFDIIYDAVGKSPFLSCIKLLNKDGFYLRSVHMGIKPFVLAFWTKLISNKTVVGGISIERKEDLILLKKMTEEGKYKSVIDRSYPLEKISEAHKYVELGHKRGNVAITIEHKDTSG